MAAWSTRLKAHGFYFNAYVNKRGPAMTDGPSDIIKFNMPFTALDCRFRTRISIVNVREDLFKAIDDKTFSLPYSPSPMFHINYMLSKYGDDCDNTSITYVLPTFNELYSVQETRTANVVTTEPVGNGQYRKHTRHAGSDDEAETEAEADSDEDDDDELDDNISVLSEIEHDNSDISENDVDASKLRIDINMCRWGIREENETRNTACVMREYSPDFKKGATIETGTLYHRPLYYSDCYAGYWINRDSELYRLIKTNNNPNPAGSWMVHYKSR